MTKFQNERVNKDLKSVMSQFRDAYKSMSDASRLEYIKTLAPGASVPEEGRIYGDDKRAEFESLCQGYRAKVNDIIQGAIKDLKTKVTESPSSDAVNTITLLNLRTDITPEEIEDLISRYGDNVQAYKAITSVAIEKGVKGFDTVHPVEIEIRDAEDLESAIERSLNIASATSGHTSDAFLDMIDLQIDNVFPVDGE